ncbi:conserved hypothetical protein [Coccidioides posadasii str. Silveira]|uniref:Uncharacterized protein n=1 Tax=Coccidioides posadasii (strain RMSCC 757 / Silveira) TaxID=443226 RepID=E9DH12_COCPS|nr:conserved hypothetical protein [Coccidioides posadasii str. Silveira]
MDLLSQPISLLCQGSSAQALHKNHKGNNGLGTGFPTPSGDQALPHQAGFVKRACIILYQQLVKRYSCHTPWASIAPYTAYASGDSEWAGYPMAGHSFLLPVG